MKKILVALWCLALCVGLFLYSFSTPETPAVTEPTTGATEPSTTAPTTNTPSVQSTKPTIPEPDSQLVYVLNQNPQMQEKWELLADDYAQQTGVQITVIGDLSQRTDPKGAVLVCATGKDARQMAADSIDLTDTVAYTQLAGSSFALSIEEKIWAIPSDIAIFGLIYNETLLARTGYTRVDLNTFADLKAVAEHITKDAEVLEFGAFATAKANLTEFLSAVPADCRQIWDLYAQNRVDGTLADGQAVFSLGSIQEFEQLSQDESLRLGMIPMYVGNENEQNQTFCAVATGYWSIRADGSEDNIAAAVTFLNFLVNPRLDGTVPVDELELLAPYRQATFANNIAESLLRSDLAAGKECLICVNPQVPEGLAEALNVYGTDPTDENWAAVQALLQNNETDEIV